MLTKPIWTIIIASGNLKKYVLYNSGISLMLFPISYMAFQMGASPDFVYMCNLLIIIIITLVQLWILHDYLNYSIRRYFVKVILPISKSFVPSFAVSWVIHYCFGNSLIGTIISLPMIFLLTALTIYVLGLNQEEKNMILNRILIFKNNVLNR